LAQEAEPHLAKSAAGGRLIFISSVCGTRTSFPGLSLYGAAKAGLDAFVRALAIEVGGLGITVNTINPGMIASDRLHESMSPETQQAMTRRYPVARVGTTDDIAELAMFL